MRKGSGFRERYIYKLTGVGGHSLGGHTAGLDVIVEGDCLGQLDQGNVVLECVMVPVLSSQYVNFQLVEV